ncbi:hypothetical protein, partial [Burkholderia dolosa]|uniref:hypothetical protein n=1 Tax=Burkholderia dolosa TaxID=152500 RepID=UPI001C968A2F
MTGGDARKGRRGHGGEGRRPASRPPRCRPAGGGGGGGGGGGPARPAGGGGGGGEGDRKKARPG